MSPILRENLMAITMTAVIIAVITFLVFWVGASNHRLTQNCRDRGGVPVEPRNGPIVCLKEEALK